MVIAIITIAIITIIHGNKTKHNKKNERHPQTENRKRKQFPRNKQLFTHLQPHGLLGQISLVLGILCIVNNIRVRIDVGWTTHERPHYAVVVVAVAA